MKSKNMIAAFQHAVDGILHAYRTQRHVRIHVALIVPLLLLARLLNFDREKTVMLFFAISLVLICELFNTALENSIDLFTDKYHPLAKHAKDIAAGAVLIATLNAIAVGSFLFVDEHRMKELMQQMQAGPRVIDSLLVITLTLTVLFVCIFMWKVRGKKGTFLQGGVVSGHSALAFFLACVIVFTTTSWTAATIAFLLALLVSQSRIEGNIHTLQETVLGAVLGIVVTLLIFQVLPHLMERWAR